MSLNPWLAAFDMEGVFTPEIWIAVAEKTKIKELRLTTRDIPDYDQLMRGRIRILDQHGLKLRDIQEVIGSLDLLPGAKDFLDWIRRRMPAVILSDTFYEFAAPLIEKLGNPVLFCNSLVIDNKGRIADYQMRMESGKLAATTAFQALNFRVVACGDSYNDTKMLVKADRGILFRPPQNVIQEFPQFPVVTDYSDLLRRYERILAE